VFSGNELGALLGWWLFTSWKEKNQGQSNLKDTYMLSSTVSSKILRAIALKEGFHFEVRCLGDLGFSAPQEFYPLLSLFLLDFGTGFYIAQAGLELHM